MRSNRLEAATLRLVTALAAAAALAAAGPAPSAWAGALTGRDLATALAAGAAALGWVLLALLALAVALEALTHLPGALGRLASSARRLLVPPLVRGLVAAALGAPIVAAPAAAAGPAAVAPRAPADRVATAPASTAAALPPAAEAPPRPHPALPLLDRVPVLAPPAPDRAPAVPTGPPPSGRPAPADAAEPAGPSAPGQVVVAPGDSLWRIAARSLGRSAPAAEVARLWPRWWSANRRAVGDDPDLIHPGQRLRPPAPAGSTTPPAAALRGRP